MLIIRTKVKSSGISGCGLFADERIFRGQLIWVLNPAIDIVVSDAVVERLPLAAQEFFSVYSYGHRSAPRARYLNVDNARFMNHSSAPNTDFKRFFEGFALRDVDVGEELTCDYSEFDEDWLEKL